jgi:hypothetical protein
VWLEVQLEEEVRSEDCGRWLEAVVRVRRSPGGRGRATVKARVLLAETAKKWPDIFLLPRPLIWI